MEEAARGVIASLAAAGYRDGETIRLRRFNAEGDAATSNAIARELIAGEYDLIITLSTLSLQAVAAPTATRRFAMSSAWLATRSRPASGSSRDDPMKHPPYMVGLGTMQPVAEAFRLAKNSLPAWRGSAWPGTRQRQTPRHAPKSPGPLCRELGIELLEANVDNSAGVAKPLVRSSAGEPRRSGSAATPPCWPRSTPRSPPRDWRASPCSRIPPVPAPGATLFDLALIIFSSAARSAKLAGRVLDGESPASLPILFEVPKELWLSPVALDANQIRVGRFPRISRRRRTWLVEKKGPVRLRPRVEFAKAARNHSRPSRLRKIGLISVADAKVVDDAYDGLRQGLKEAGLVDGRDFKINYKNAQGDIATLNSICDEMSGNDTEVVIVLTTTALQAALRKIENKPLVFALVLDPFTAGAGKSATDHRPNVTGVYLAFPYAEVARTIREVLPGARRVGTLFSPGELNSALARDRFEECSQETGPHSHE